MSLMKTKNLYFVYSIYKHNFSHSIKPCVVIDEGERIGFSIMRDVDFSILVNEGNKIEVGIIKVKKENISKIRNLNEETINNMEGIEIIYKCNCKVRVVNKRKFLETTRGEFGCEDTHDNKFHFSMFLYEKDYMMTTPTFYVKERNNIE